MWKNGTRARVGVVTYRGNLLNDVMASGDSLINEVLSRDTDYHTINEDAGVFAAK